MKNMKNVFIGIVAVILIILAVIWFLPENETTGAVTEERKEDSNCVDLSGDDIYRACTQWKANNYGAKPGSLDIFSTNTARTICTHLEADAC